MKDKLTTAIDAFKNSACTPERMAAILYASAMPEDDVLDLLKALGDGIGWTKQLSRTGEVYLAMVAEAERDVA